MPSYGIVELEDRARETTAQVVFSPKYFIMEHEQMEKLAETLKKWEVPAILGTRSAMHLLLGNALRIWGELQEKA